MLEFRSSDGKTTLDGHSEGFGYSGHSEGRNNPAMESEHMVGPIPRGRYKIGPAFDHPQKGPICFRLTPDGHDALGRSGFMIHGDNITHDASEGCIILGRLVRQAIRDDHETVLEVV